MFTLETLVLFSCVLSQPDNVATCSPQVKACYAKHQQQSTKTETIVWRCASELAKQEEVIKE